MKAFFAALGTTARLIIGVVFLCTLYLVPAGIAVLRNRSNTVAIFLMNLLLGWTFLGWVLALIWSVKTDKSPRVIVIQEQAAAR